MMRKALAPRIDYSEAILADERNLLDALMKSVRFDVFEYIVDEIWNIVTNPLRSYGFAPYIQYMIEMVTKDKFHKDSRHDPLRLRIRGLLVLVLLLLLLLLLLTLPAAVVPLLPPAPAMAF
jgi:hypothetical protein